MTNPLVPAKLVGYSIAASSGLLAIIQAAPEVDTLSRYERLGLVTFLLACVVYLVRRIEKKESASDEARDSMVKALTLSIEVMRGLRQAVSELKESVDRLVTVREAIQR